MKSKKITLKSGKICTLYLNESTNSWTLDRNDALLSLGNFQRFIIDNEDCVVANKERTSIIEYYNNSDQRNKDKIVSMIDEDINKVQAVFNIIIETIINKRKIK